MSLGGLDWDLVLLGVGVPEWLYYLEEWQMRYVYLISCLWGDPSCRQNHSTVNLTLLYSKTCLKWPLKKEQKLVSKIDYRLMQVKSIAECSKRAFCNTFDLSLSYHLWLRSLFCLFLSGRFRQVLLCIRVN